MRILRNIALPIALAAGLSGCMVQDLIDKVEMQIAKPLMAAKPKDESPRLDTIAFADAYCRQDRDAALATAHKLAAENPTHPKALLLYGIALHLSGHGTKSYRLLERLAAGKHSMPASLQCGQDYIYSGSVSEVAQRRLFEVKTQLQALDVSLPLPDAATVQRNEGVIYRLAGMAPARPLFIDRPQEPAPMEVAKKQAVAPAPAHAAPEKKMAEKRKPRVFVHLGSYKSMRTLDRGWRTLKSRFRKALAEQDKSVRKVDLGKKGRYLRLGVDVASKASANRLCREIKRGGQYCAVMGS